MIKSGRVARILGGAILVAVVALAAPALVSGQAAVTLPAGGGEPGKVYLEAQKAMKAQDIPALKKVMSAERVKDMDKPDFKQMLGMIAEMMPKSVEVTGGTMTGDKATLKMTAGSGAEKSTGEAQMVKEGGAWKLDKEAWKN
jgi:hypothetical protein